MLQNVSNGLIFTVDFVKRSNGELRTMNCRKGVRKGVSGVGLKYNPAAKALVPVFDMKKGFRMIALESIQRIAMGGKVYQVA